MHVVGAQVYPSDVTLRVCVLARPGRTIRWWTLRGTRAPGRRSRGPLRGGQPRGRWAGQDLLSQDL